MDARAEAGTLEDAGAASPEDAAAPDPTPGDASTVSQVPDAGRRLPEQPAEFEIELAGGECFGDCPTFKLDIDQAGNVVFRGAHCAARPGAFTYMVSPDDARAIYEALAATKYAALGDRYTRAEDGCRLATDMPTFSWRVRADDFEKPLERYQGCEGVDGLPEIDAVMAVVHERSDTLRFLQPTVFNCGWGAESITNVGLRLSLAGTPVAMVKIAKEGDWRGNFVLEDCAGDELARGDLIVESRRWLLIDARGTPIALPAGLGDAGSIVIARWPADGTSTTLQTTSVQAFLVDDELDFEFAEADSCTQ